MTEGAIVQPTSVWRRIWEERSEILLGLLLYGHFVLAVAAAVLIAGCNAMPQFEGAPSWISRGLFFSIFTSCLVSIFDRMYEQENRVILAVSCVMHLVVIFGAFAQCCYLGVRITNAPLLCSWLYNGAVTTYAAGFAIIAGMAIVAVFTPDPKHGTRAGK